MRSLADGRNTRALKDKKVPTPGMEKEVFPVAAASDSADFDDVRKKVSEICRSKFQTGGDNGSEGH